MHSLRAFLRPLVSLAPLHLVGWVAWFLVLWFLSSGEVPIKDAPEIPHLDKIMHWGYFGIGGALLALYTLSSTQTTHLSRAVAVGLLLLGIAVGALDEWHQCWCVHRTGKDLGDLSADALGTLCGLVVAPRVWRWLRVPSSSAPA